MTFVASQFDFNAVEKVHLHKHLFSQYGQHIGKAAKQLREMFEMIQMNPVLAVSINVAVFAGDTVGNNGMGENYQAALLADVPPAGDFPSPIIECGVHEGDGAIDNEGEVAYMSKAQVLEVFDQFVQEHHAKDFVSRNGEAKIQFVSFAHKVRIFIQMLDDKACHGMVGSIDPDPNESSFNLAIDYMEPEALISLNLYAP